jgi:hypothetical protein
MLVVTEYELAFAPLDRVPAAGVERGLELIEAGCGRGPVTVAIPREPAPAVYPPPEPVQGAEHDQADRQARDGHEEYEGHARSTCPADQAFPPAPAGASHLQVRPVESLGQPCSTEPRPYPPGVRSCHSWIKTPGRH